MKYKINQIELTPTQVAELGLRTFNPENRRIPIIGRIKIATLRRATLPAIGLCLAALLSGCGTVKVSRTVGLPGMNPLGNADQVKLVKIGTTNTQPHQVVGKVTISKELGFLYNNKASSYQRMKEVAAGMGADGLIVVREKWVYDKTCEMQVSYCSGLAVKWLTPGEAERPLTKPFIVGMLPMAQDPEAPGNQVALAEAIGEAIAGPLELKGYYLLPPGSVTYKGGLEGARELKGDELQALGGEDAHFLLEASIVSRSQVNVIIQANAQVEIKSTLMDKATRVNVYEGVGFGRGSAGWLLNMVDTNLKRNIAATAGTSESLKALKPICEELPK
jgi:hypothetical protein